MVKCTDCGLLALRHYESRQLRQAEPEWRKTGGFVADDVKRLYSGPALCLARRQVFPSVNDDRACFEEVAKDRDCDSFVVWHQGFPPKEHQEMINAQMMLEAQRKREDEDRRWREQQSAERRKWQEQQEAQQREWREEDVRRAKADMKVKILVPICTAILGALATWFVKDVIQPPHLPTPPTSASATSNPPSAAKP